MAASLTTGLVCSRNDLRALFDIRDATINTGVFRPAGRDEIWLFVTERKSADRIQFKDKLDGGTLRWQGQMSGRTDRLIIEHQARGLKLLVFYRRTKNEFPNAGFRFEGEFRYSSHSTANPTNFILVRVD